MTGRARILLVDDRPENLLALEAILGSLDVDLVRASSGEEALAALLRTDFALILLDAQMPGMDGYETATRIKRRLRTRDVPIIFLTAVDKDLHSSYRGYVAGGADYLLKPFDPWILRAKVQVFVNLWETSRLQTSQAALLSERDQAGRGLPDGLGTGLEELEEAVDRLAAALGDGRDRPDGEVTGVPAELDLVRQRLRELRQTVAPGTSAGPG